MSTFIDIFNTNEPHIEKIVIPMIQRDYAQGRQNPHALQVRERFLDALNQAIVKDKKITLDFIYGDIDVNGVLTPLDGQQRLTTLFLLHWYAVKKGQIPKDQAAFLEKFSYETRYSAREFCNFLVEFTPKFQEKLSDEICDAAGFPLSWKKDPTISSMLTMLDAIDDKFRDCDNLGERLQEGAVSFSFLSIKDMGLTDDLYIRMNSRGKPLTLFEHFKAELEKNLKEAEDNGQTDAGTTERISTKIDIDWTNMLWLYSKDDDHLIDNRFLNYFRFICDILCYQSDGSTLNESTDVFALIKKYFSKEAKNIEDNILKFESFFDCWKDIATDFFSQYINGDNEHISGKVKSDDAVNIFQTCLNKYAKKDEKGQPVGKREFQLKQIVLLFAITFYLQNKEQITDEQFRRRFRIVNNLVQNSSEELSESENRDGGGNRMPAIIRQTEAIMTSEDLTNTKLGFNDVQWNEEIAKQKWLEDHQNDAEKLFALEDHPLLYGRIAVVDLDNVDHFDRFRILFDCDKDKVDRALMTFGNYTQADRGIRRQSGSAEKDDAWKKLFHKNPKARDSSDSDFKEIKKCLYELLKNENIDNDGLDEIAGRYIKGCNDNKSYDWRYYYIKYACFRPKKYGKYDWEDFKNKPYAFRAFQTEQRESSSSYQPFLKAFLTENDNVEDRFEDNGRRMRVSGYYLFCENNAYVLKKKSDQDDNVFEEIGRYTIPQNDGIDTVDRIEKFRRIYEEISQSNNPDNLPESCVLS